MTGAEFGSYTVSVAAGLGILAVAGGAVAKWVRQESSVERLTEKLTELHEENLERFDKIEGRKDTAHKAIYEKLNEHGEAIAGLDARVKILED